MVRQKTTVILIKEVWVIWGYKLLNFYLSFRKK
jgi:hypothetical protein